MVGQMTLNHRIEVRILVSEPNEGNSRMYRRMYQGCKHNGSDGEDTTLSR